MRKQQHEPRSLQPVHQESQRLEGHGIGPVQILDDDQQRRLGKTPFEDGADRVKDLPPKLLGLHMLQNRIGVAKAQNMEIEGHQALGLLAQHAKLRERVGKPGLRLCRRRLSARCRRRCAAQRRECHRIARPAASRRPVGSPRRRSGPRPRRARRTHSPGAFFRCRLRRPDAPVGPLRRHARSRLPIIARDFGVTADQRRAKAEHVEAPRGTRRVERPLQTMDQHTAHLAAQSNVA